MAAAADHRQAAAVERILAVRNALVMGLALAASWVIGIAVRFILPRHLGPERFGLFSFADGFAAAFFVLLALGVDSYTRREVPVRPTIGNDFVGGVFAARLLLSALLLCAMVVTLRVTHRPAAAVQMVLLFGAGQFFASMSGTLSALLQAGGSVRQMSIFNVIAKLIWGCGILLSLFLGLGLWALALSYLVSEMVRAVALLAIARRAASLELRFSMAGTREALIGSLPFFVFTAAQTFYLRIDVTFIEALVGTREVGWFGAADSLIVLAMMAAPVLNWVLLPMLVRARARSAEEFDEFLRGTIRLVLAFSLPLTLAIELAAPWIVGLVFGPAFAPAALPLRVQGLLWIAMYLNAVISIALTADGRAWTVTNLSFLAIGLTLVLNGLLVPWGARLIGPGGGGAGSALAGLVTEAVVTAFLVGSLGASRCFDLRTLTELKRTLVAVAMVVALELFLNPRMGPARLILEAAVYLALIAALRAFPLAEVISTVREAIRHREKEGPE